MQELNHINFCVAMTKLRTLPDMESREQEVTLCMELIRQAAKRICRLHGIVDDPEQLRRLLQNTQHQYVRNQKWLRKSEGREEG